jgi:hypothetical protein
LASGSAAAVGGGGIPIQFESLLRCVTPIYGAACDSRLCRFNKAGK